MARRELLGLAFIVAAGVPLHFLYSSTHWNWLAWLAPINESVWEHFKLAFWPGLAWALIARNSNRPNYWLARWVSMTSTPITIALVFYAGRAWAPAAGIAYDIVNFFVSVALGQWLGYRVLKREASFGLEIAAMADLILFCLLFIGFSYWPPSWGLFVPPR